MSVARRKPRSANVGVFGVGFHKYWPQFDGLLDELVQKGELTEAQGKKLFDELIAKGRSESRVLAERMATQILKLLEKSPFATRREFHLLEQRVRSLEVAMGAAVPDEVEPQESEEGTPSEHEV